MKTTSMFGTLFAWYHDMEDHIKGTVLEKASEVDIEIAPKTSSLS